MRLARLKVDSGKGVAYYHCISRVVDRQFIFGDNEREQFVHWMQAYAEFCGVQVLTYCVMSNHFHVLLAVSQRPEVLPGEEELLRRYGLVHGDAAVERLRREMDLWTAERRQEWCQGMYAQMWDLSAYMKLLKQRFTQWYNRRQERKGTLWEERFKSVLVEGSREALARVGAYIDLNPIRARLVEDPKDYWWSGYGASMGGKRIAREGIRRMLELSEGNTVTSATLTEAMAHYRMWVYGQGMEEGVAGGDTPTLRAGIAPEKVREVLAQRGQLSWAEYVRCRVRYFTDGTVIGSRAWANQVFEEHRHRFGPKRQDGARKLRFLEGSPLYGWRDLRVKPVAA